MRLVIEIPDEAVKTDNIANDFITYFECCTPKLFETLKKGTPLLEHLNKIKDDIGKYELDCRFADYSQTDECTICNKNVFGSIYKIIDKYIEGSESE